MIYKHLLQKNVHSTTVFESPDYVISIVLGCISNMRYNLLMTNIRMKIERSNASFKKVI